jgi:hypothetical protein
MDLRSVRCCARESPPSPIKTLDILLQRSRHSSVRSLPIAATDAGEKRPDADIGSGHSIRGSRRVLFPNSCHLS